MSVGDAFVVTPLVMIGVQVCGLLAMPLCPAQYLKGGDSRSLGGFLFFGVAHLFSNNGI